MLKSWKQPISHVTLQTGKYICFRRIDDDKGKTYELGQSAVKCMRGILACWLKQADKVRLLYT